MTKHTGTKLIPPESRWVLNRLAGLLGLWSSAHVVFALALLTTTGIHVQASDWQSEWDMPPGFSICVDTEGYEFPTAIAFVPKPGADPKSPLYFVTEIRGKVKVVTRDRSVYTFGQVPFDMAPLKELPSLDGEAGMAAIALDPAHGYVFVSLAYYDTNQVLRNAMVRFDSEPGVFGIKARSATPFTSIFKNDISSLTHQAGGISIEGDTLYVGVGDGGQHHQSQNLDSTLGKILRMSLNFEPLPDNPFYEEANAAAPQNFIWARGLRNPFGLYRVSGRTFVSENGFAIDRFLEVKRGENCGWNGTDWSIGMNAAMVIGPSVAPVQIAWLPPESTIFPEEYRSKFYVALGGGMSRIPGVLMIDYDFHESRLARPPKQIVLHANKERLGVYPTGVAFGSDGLYMVSLYSVRNKRFGNGEVLRLAYKPVAQNEASFAGMHPRAEILMLEKGCYSCHGRQLSDLNVAPPLDRETLVPRIITRLDSATYQRSLRGVDSLKTAPQNCFREARQEVLSKAGTERARVWMKYHIMEPKFDRMSASMPNLGLTAGEAEEIANYLVSRNVGATGVTGALKRLIHPYIYGPVGRRHMPGAFGAGFATAFACFAVSNVIRGRKRASDPLPSPDIKQHACEESVQASAR